MTTENTIMQIVADALKVNRNRISMDSSIDTVNGWDSLIQLDILARIDKETNGKAASVRDLATSLSVKAIIGTLRKNGLIDG